MQTDYITSDILFLDWLGGRKSSPKQPYHIKVEQGKMFPWQEDEVEVSEHRELPR